MTNKTIMLIFSAFLAFVLAGCEQKGGMDNIVQAVGQSSAFNSTVTPIVNQVKSAMENASAKLDQAVELTKQKMQELINKVSSRSHSISSMNKSESLNYKVTPQHIEIPNSSKPQQQAVEPHDGIALLSFAAKSVA